MKDELEKRLSNLRTEFENGQKLLAEFEAKQANLRNSLLRIGGAIQVLEELLAREEPEVKKETVSSNHKKQPVAVE